MRIRGADVRPRGPAPALGEHSRDVLEEAGFGAEEIDAADCSRRALRQARDAEEGRTRSCAGTPCCAIRF
jgi:hypothetical protein